MTPGEPPEVSLSKNSLLRICTACVSSSLKTKSSVLDGRNNTKGCSPSFGGSGGTNEFGWTGSKGSIILTILQLLSMITKNASGDGKPTLPAIGVNSKQILLRPVKKSYCNDLISLIVPLFSNLLSMAPVTRSSLRANVA